MNKKQNHREEGSMNRAEVDVYLVEYGPHKGKYRWSVQVAGLVLDSGHADTADLAHTEAARAVKANKQVTFNERVEQEKA